ncbi:RNA polymerase sigma factor [Saccharothrix syringae]|uniref:RNA polymerase sigma factor n=1 Tax=Saccharothrix syringae TaxID=103733 RepID=UPI000B122A9F|nr:sigma-70 family RNA polymerase sigma factor [Saccharothrix syringae]
MEVIAKYGHALMMSWLRSEAIFARCAEKGCAVGGPPPYWEHEDLVSLAGDTVVKAIDEFRRKALLGGEWDPAGGASLKSYFTTACVYAFPNVYRKWSTDFNRRRRESARSMDLEGLVGTATTTPNPADAAVTRLEVKRGLAAIADERTRQALVLREAGYTVREIAESLGTSHGTIKGLLERHRRTADQPVRDGGGNA